MPTRSEYGRLSLTPHPASHCPAIRELVVTVRMDEQARLVLTYQLHADLQSLQLPEPRPPMRTDGLWRHTCFEAFLAPAGGSEYWEYNFSPSGAWAAYRFAGYREGMAPLMRGMPPELVRDDGDDRLLLAATVDLSWLPPQDLGSLKLGLAAVVEDRSRTMTWWALTHPAGKPDFHHADGFVVDLGTSATSKLLP